MSKNLCPEITSFVPKLENVKAGSLACVGDWLVSVELNSFLGEMTMTQMVALCGLKGALPSVMRQNNVGKIDLSIIGQVWGVYKEWAEPEGQLHPLSAAQVAAPRETYLLCAQLLSQRMKGPRSGDDSSFKISRSVVNALALNNFFEVLVARGVNACEQGKPRVIDLHDYRKGAMIAERHHQQSGSSLEAARAKALMSLVDEAAAKVYDVLAPRRYLGRRRRGPGVLVPSRS